MFVPKDPIDNKPALIQVMAYPVHWRIYAALGGDELNDVPLYLFKSEQPVLSPSLIRPWSVLQRVVRMVGEILSLSIPSRIPKADSEQQTWT